MLDSMRKNLKKLNWVLWIVILSFVATIFLVWGMEADSTDSRRNVVATVNGEPITRVQYANARRNVADFYRRTFGDQFESFAQNLNLEAMALNALIEESLVRQEADRLGIRISDQAVAASIAANQAFQEGGRFSAQRYRQVLDAMNVKPDQYEEDVRSDLKSQRARDLLDPLPAVSEQEILEELKLRNDQIAVDAIVLSERELAERVAVTDEEKRKYYDAHQAQFQIPETVSAQYVAVDRAKVQESIQPTAEELTAYYEQNKQQRFQQQEQVHARHILFRVPEDATDEQEKAVLERAQGVYEEILKGRDFAEAASALTEDPTGKHNGGDLGWFERGRMVPEFEQKAFSMKPGELSEPVLTDFGYHIIRLEGQRPAGFRPQAEVEEQIRAILRRERSTEMARQAAEKARMDLQAGKSPAEAAAAHGLESGTTGFFGLTDEIPGIGREPAIARTVFAMPPGNVSDVQAGVRGFYVFKLLERREPHQGSFEEVEARVVELLRSEKAGELLKSEASAVKAELASTPMSQAAQKRNLEVKQAPSLRRGGFIPGVGRVPPEIETILFSAEPDAVVGPVEVEQGLAFFRLAAKKPADVAELESSRDQLRRELVSRKRSVLAQDWLSQLKARARIQLSAEVERMQNPESRAALESLEY
jgi:peptidyl-prolyl cis-trans isomerase D